MTRPVRRVAALYDIHGNLPALEAVLQDLRGADVDQIVIGGDALPGPMPLECLARLGALERPAHFIFGNGERAILAQVDAGSSGRVEYWGTPSGKPLPESVQQITRWCAERLDPTNTAWIRSWPGIVSLHIDALGPVLFCHGTPRSEVECFTRLTPAERLLPVFEGLGVSRVVCGHTHMQFDRTVGEVRVVNAGSVGMPFGKTGADWLLLGPGVELRHTNYDLAEAAAAIRATDYPQAEAFAATSILNPPSEDSMLGLLTHASF